MPWERHEQFDLDIVQATEKRNTPRWVDFQGSPVNIGEGVTLTDALSTDVPKIQSGDLLGDVSKLVLRDPNSFCAGELHNHVSSWEAMVAKSHNHNPIQQELLQGIRHKVSLFQYFQHYKGSFQGMDYDCARPPHRTFRNNTSCQKFIDFIRRTLIERVKSGAISVYGKVGEVRSPHIVLPLTVEPTKPRLCHDARYLNLWMRDLPFQLDKLSDLPRYVSTGSFQTIIDDKSGYDHILLTKDSRTFFGMQWGGWYFTYNTLPFGWKCSPYIYHNTGLLATNYFRTIGIPCSLYIDDRHNGQLQVSLTEGAYVSLKTSQERRFMAAQSALFLVVYYLVQLGYFLGIGKSIFIPQLVVPYLGFLSDSSEQTFRLIREKRDRFLELVRLILKQRTVTVKTLQRLVGKCVAFSLAVPAAKLFTREMNAMISWGHRTRKVIPLKDKLREEIAHWLFLESWDASLPWREERHVRISMATDASGSGWGGCILSPISREASDYWCPEERGYDIATREAMAIHRFLRACQEDLRDAWVDVMVDNQAVVFSWNNQGARSRALNDQMKTLFFVTAELNISLHLFYVPTDNNPADRPSRRLSVTDSKLTPAMWHLVQTEFGGDEGHTCDLMALDSNVMNDRNGHPLPHFTPCPSVASAGVNLFAQDLRRHQDILSRPHVFPPSVLVGPVLRFLESYQQSCTILVLDVYPRKYWWPLLHYRAHQVRLLAPKGDDRALLVPSRNGWTPYQGIPGDLWAFGISF